MKQLATIIAAVIALAHTVPALAHGVRITHTMDEVTGEVTVTAAFDTGEPLANAQVTIFSPSDLVNPWQSDTTDEQGQFTFLPDYTDEGFWEVQVRQAGHGGSVNLEITASMMPEAPSENEASEALVTAPDGTSTFVISGDARFEVQGDVVISATGTTTTSGSMTTTSGISLEGFTATQIVIVSVSVIWGCVGTALYFARRK